MLLTLIRLTMIVPLLVSAVRVEANLEKLPFVPSERVSKVVDKSRERNDDLAREDEKHVHGEDSKLAEKDELKKDHRYAEDREARIRRGDANAAENRFPRSGSGGLAHKMAKDALNSPKVQETINKLSHMSSPKGGSLGAATKGSRIGKHSAKVIGGKGRRGGPGHRARRKKKRKRHHRRPRKHYPRISTRRGGSSKRTLGNKRDTSVSPAPSYGRRSSATKARVESSTSGSRDGATVVQVDDNDYVDFSTAPSTESPEISIESSKIDSPVSAYEGETMIERLMKTTTKDPTEKRPVDQGVEYSDYYSDDEVLQDIVANKIPVQLVGSKGSNDRFARQALNCSSYRHGDQIRRSDRYRRGYDPRRKDARHGDYSVNSLNDFQNDPTIERLPTSADDPSPSYPTNYGPLENPNENTDTSYPVHADGAPGQSQTIDGGYKLQNNYDPVDTNKLRPPVYAQSPGRSNYLNRYESSQGGAVNINEAVQPKVPQHRSSSAYQSADANLGQVDNLDVENQPAMDGDTGVSNAKESTELRVESGSAAIPVHNDQEEQDGQISNNVPAQSRYNLPAVNLPNAMDQPFGKVLESLGINVNDGSNDIGPKPYLNENINRPVSPCNTIDRPVGHVISPSYLKKTHQEDAGNSYVANNARGSDYQTAELRSGSNAKESYSRRQSIQDRSYDSNNMPRLYNDKDPAQNVNISIAVHDTKEVANQILDTIMEELEELKADRSKNSKREGSWSTAQAGMKLDMRVLNRSIIVTLSDLATPRFHESLLNGTWNVSGHAPFRRGSPFTLIATDNSTNSMAVFVGACRVCQGVDTVAGVWSVARQPKDCRDFQVSTSVFNDIFKKTKLSSLKETQGTNATEEATLKHDKRKS